METPEIVDLVNHEKKLAASLEVHTTPTALLDDNFVVRLDGGEQLSSFRLFFAIAMASLPATDDTDLAGEFGILSKAGGLLGVKTRWAKAAVLTQAILMSVKKRTRILYNYQPCLRS